MQVVLEEQEDGQTKKVPLRIVGIGNQACLVACNSQGTVFELHPDGNRCVELSCAGMPREQTADTSVCAWQLGLLQGPGQAESAGVS